MQISRIAINRPVTTVMIFFSVLLLGMVSLDRLPVQFIPDMSMPGMGCFVRYARTLGTEEMERQIVKPIEAEIAQMAGVKDMWVHGHRGSSAFFRIQFDFGTNAKFRVIELQERLDRFKNTFPKGALMIHAFPFDSSWDNQNFMGIAVQGPRHDPYLQGINVDKVVQKLQDIDGVAEADSWGGHREVIEVAVHEDRMQEFNQPLYSLTNTVRSYAADPIFVGEIEELGQRHFVRVDGQFKDAQELSDVILNPDGAVYLRHMAQVNEVLLSRGRLSRVNGKPSVTYRLNKESDVNPLELSKRVRAAMTKIEDVYLPPGYSLTTYWDDSEIIRKLIAELTRLAGIGIILAMMVLHAFVRSFRMTLLVCVVIPISIIATFNLMYFSDMSINLLTLVGLAIGVGSLLDNSIVVLENIARHRQRGMEAKDAAARGASEVTRPIVALTLTSIIVFLPIVFLKGELQIVFREGALAVIYPLLVSVAVALLLVPMAATYLYHHTDRLKKRRREDGETNAATLDRGGAGGSWQLSTGLEFVRTRASFRNFRAAYLRVLKGCLRHRVRLLFAVAAVILYTWFYTMADVNRGSRVRQPEDNDYFSVFVFPPEGSRLEFTAGIVSRVEDLLEAKVPERDIIRSHIDDDDAYIGVRLVSASERDRELPEIKESLRQDFENIAEAEVAFEYTRQRGESTSVIDESGRGSIELKGPDQNSLMQIIDLLRPLIEQIDGVRDVFSDLERGPLELQFHLDRDAANLLQVNPQSLGWQLAAAQSQGDLSQIRMKRDDEDIDIVFQQVTEERDPLNLVIERNEGLGLSEMRRIPIFSPTLMDTVPLENLGSFQMVRQPYRINRQNQQRFARLFYSLAPNAKFGEIEAQVKAICDNYPLPAGFAFGYGGRSKEFDEIVKSLQTMALLALILVYMLMASLFESFYQPFIILFTIILALVPIIWGLILTGTEFGEMAVFGAIFLIGLLPNSGILLVNFASAMRRDKTFTRSRAVFLACSYRLRPILMTVGTTVLGLLPIAIRTSGSEAQWVPFAVVVISGLLGSTILTLLLIPGFYFIFEDLWKLVGRGVKYILSLRWVFVFWSGRVRAGFRERVTAYRHREPREEPLKVQTWNLTRIYAPPVLLRVQARLQSVGRLLWIPRPAPVGLIAGPPISVNANDAKPNDAGSPKRAKAIAGVNLEIERGVFGLLGPNGAGKTTLIRILVGIDQPTRGTTHICGYDMVHEGAKAQHLVGYLPQDFGVYGNRTARDYLRHYALLKGYKSRRERDAAVDRALEMVNLSDVADVKVGGFSGGMTRRIGLAEIFLRPPKVLVVDEPTAGLDPLERLRFRNLLTQLAADRIVVLSTHIVEDVEHTCRNLAILEEGIVTYCGSRDDLVERAAGRVCELDVDDRTWSEARTMGEVTAMARTATGLKLRLVTPGPPPHGGRPVTPNLEDAYVYHTVVTGKQTRETPTVH